MRLIIPLGLTILLVGCGTTTNYYTQTVQSWQGGSVNQLTKRWGRPDDQMKNSQGNTVYVYKTEGYRSSSAPTMPSPSAGISYSANGKPVVVTQTNTNTTWNRGMSNTCTAFFIADNRGKIVETKIAGETCFVSSGFAQRMENPTKSAVIEKKP